MTSTNGLVLVEQEETIRRVIDDAAKALLARAQLILCPLALGDVAHQAQKPASALLKLAGAYLHRKRRPVLAPMASLKSDRFSSGNALSELLNGRLVQTGIEIARVHANQFFPAVAETDTGLAVDVHNYQLSI